MKRPTRWLAVPLMVLVFPTLGAPTVLAAPPPVHGTVVATDHYKVRVVVVGRLPSWVTRRGSIGFLGMESFVLDVHADTVDVGSSNASTVKLGDLVTLKPPAAQVQGTVVATGYYTVRVVVFGKLPSWVKKAGNINFIGMESFVTDVKADTVDIGGANAGAAKLGDVVTLKKWQKPNGC